MQFLFIIKVSKVHLLPSNLLQFLFVILEDDKAEKIVFDIIMIIIAILFAVC